MGEKNLYLHHNKKNQLGKEHRPNKKSKTLWLTEKNIIEYFKGLEVVRYFLIETQKSLKIKKK